jgi:Flp pilus assembly protein TadB
MTFVTVVLESLVRALALPILWMFGGATWVLKNHARRNAKIKGQQLDIAARADRSPVDIRKRMSDGDL